MDGTTALSTSTEPRTRRHRLGIIMSVIAVVGSVTLLASACTVDQPPAGSNPKVPRISSFTATAPSNDSPATVTLAWKIADLGDATAACTIESDGPDFTTIEIDPCALVDSRTVTVTTDTTERTDTFTLTVHVSLGYELSATASFTVVPVETDPFDITFQGLDALDSSASDALLDAAARWEAVITTGFPTVNEFPWWCEDPDDYTMPDSVDDLMIQVIVKEMDGPGGALAAAGPSCILIEGERAVTGVIYLDEDDLATMDPQRLTLVAAHEIGHVLGIGTLWNNDDWGERHLLEGEGTSDPRYIGSNAVTEWLLLGGSGGIPVENTGEPGTRDSHWRESVFETELMTGWLGNTAQLSRMTVASLADLGFTVDLDSADPYVLSAPWAGLHALRAGSRSDTATATGDTTPSNGDDDGTVDRDDFAPRPMTPPPSA